MARLLTLVNNPGTNDPRVIRQAMQLAKAGHDVTLYGRCKPGITETDEYNGVHVFRFECYDHNTWDDAVVDGILDALPEVREHFRPYTDPFRKALGELRDRLGRAKALRVDFDAAVKRQNEAHAAFTAARDRVAAMRAEGATPEAIAEVQAVHDAELATALAAKAMREELAPKIKALEAAEELKDLKDTIARSHVFLYPLYYAMNAVMSAPDTRYDAVCANDLHPLLYAVTLHLRTGSRVVFDSHELAGEIPGDIPEERREWVRRLEHLLLKQLDGLIVTTQSSIEYFANSVPAAAESLIYYNTPEFREAEAARIAAGQPPPPGLRAMAGLGPEAKVIAFCGNIAGAPRGVDRVVRALTQLPEDVHLTVVGARIAQFDEWIVQIAESEGVRHRLHLLPGVPPALVVPTIRDANMGVFMAQRTCLNLEYTMPNKLMEFLFARLPVVVSDMRDMARVVGDLGVGRIVPATDQEALVTALRDTLAETTSRYTPEIVERIDHLYAFERQREKLIEFYARLLAKPSRQQA